MTPTISISLPCFGRPERTRRAIECIGNQTINCWEAHIIGDGCPVFQEILESQWYNEWITDVEKRGNKVITKNLEKNYGGHGYHITNTNIQNATGEYFLFYANDDIILPTHFAHYLQGIDNTPYDFVYFNSYIEPLKQLRWSNLAHGGIGHSELIVRTDFLKDVTPHSKNYGHDWSLIENMMKRTRLHRKAESQIFTYKVMHIPPNRTADTID